MIEYSNKNIMTINFKLIKKFFDEKVGNLDELNTTEKNNLVEAINDCAAKLEDTGWKDLPLQSGVSAHYSKYRKIGDMVNIKIINMMGYEIGEHTFAILPAEIIPYKGFRMLLPSTTQYNARLQLYGSHGITADETAKAGQMEIFTNTSGTNAWVDINATYFL